MKKNELEAVKEYHFEKIKRICQSYVNRENDYKVNRGNQGDTRLVEVIRLVAELDTECTRIKEIDTMLYNYDIKGGI